MLCWTLWDSHPVVYFALIFYLFSVKLNFLLLMLKCRQTFSCIRIFATIHKHMSTMIDGHCHISAGEFDQVSFIICS